MDGKGDLTVIGFQSQEQRKLWAMRALWKPSERQARTESRVARLPLEMHLPCLTSQGEGLRSAIRVAGVPPGVPIDPGSGWPAV